MSLESYFIGGPGVTDTAFLKLLSSPTTRLEAIKVWQQWRLQYDPSGLSKELKSQVKDTLTFIESLKKEITKLVPNLNLRNTRNGIISDRYASQILGKYNGAIKDIRQRVRVKEFFKIALEELLSWKTSLVKNSEISGSLDRVIEIIDGYIEFHSPVLQLSYKNEKLYLHHPFIQEDYFAIIDTLEKAYWLGFIYADGSFYQVNPDGEYNRFGIRISEKDEILIDRFARAIGFNLKYKDSYIRVREDRENNEHGVKLEFQSETFTNYLKKWGVMPSKTFRISLPDLGSRSLNLAFLLGFFDGDGTQGYTNIRSGNYDFLMQIRDRYDLPFEVTNDDYGYRLSLGGRLFNEMMNNYEYSLPRKRKIFTINKFKLDEFSKEFLEQLIWEMPPHVIAREYGLSQSSVTLLLKKYDIKKPPRSYWINHNYLGKENEVKFQEFFTFFRTEPDEQLSFYYKCFPYNPPSSIRSWVYRARRILTS